MNGDSYNENSGPNKTVGDLESYRPLVAAFKEARALYDTGASGGREGVLRYLQETYDDLYKNKPSFEHLTPPEAQSEAIRMLRLVLENLRAQDAKG